jgi:hypothetical protein
MPRRASTARRVRCARRHARPAMRPMGTGAHRTGHASAPATVRAARPDGDGPSRPGSGGATDCEWPLCVRAAWARPHRTSSDPGPWRVTHPQAVRKLLDRLWITHLVVDLRRGAGVGTVPVRRDARRSERSSRAPDWRARARSQPNAPCGRASSLARRMAAVCESRRSDRRQPLAPLGAPRVDDGATTAGLHAREKPMRAGAADFRGLVGAFHGVSEPLGTGCRRRRG